MVNNVENSVQSIELFCAAIESSRSGLPVKVQYYLRRVKEEFTNL